MTSPAVMAKVERARADMAGVRTVAGDLADRVAAAVNLRTENITDRTGAEAIAAVRARPSELSNVVVGAALYECMARLSSYANVVLNAAAEAERLDSETLATQAYVLSAAVRRLIDLVNDTFTRIENLQRQVGLRGLNGAGLQGWPAALGYTILVGTVIYIIAELIDAYDGVDTEAGITAREACEQQAQATGQRCTAEQYNSFYRDERTRESEDSVGGRLERMTREGLLEPAGKGAGDALFWMLMIGGLGVGLYFAAPYLATKAVEVKQRVRPSAA